MPPTTANGQVKAAPLSLDNAADQRPLFEVTYTVTRTETMLVRAGSLAEAAAVELGEGEIVMVKRA